MKLFIFLLLFSPFASADVSSTTCLKAEPTSAHSPPPTYFKYVETLCISDVAWHEEGTGVRFDFAISYESNYSESFPYGRRKSGPFKVSRLLPAKAMQGGFGWVLIWNHRPGYTDCHPPESSLKCSVDFDLRVGGINTPNLFFSAYTQLTQHHAFESHHRGTWTLKYSP